MAIFDRSDKERARTPEPKPAPERREAPRAEAPPRDPQAPRYPSSGAPRAQESALIGPGLEVQGEVRGDEDLILDGRVKGALNLGHHQLLIGEGGHAEADVTARKVVVYGELIGDIDAEECVELGHTARVRGNLRTPRLRIDEGAQLNGRIEMKAGQAPRKDADPGKKARKEAAPAPRADPTNGAGAGEQGATA